ncbi:hypothetical protein IWW40_002874 [Coemansia sp. RSA 1250]|nr:hypothetical protein IWW40_002874 [Coemansia sp. RSA 1250]
MAGSSLAELKKRQQQRRQQQAKTSGTKRKREVIAHPQQQQQQQQQQPASSTAAKLTIDAASKALAQKIRSSDCASPFAASLRALKDDPFDIINHDILNHQNIYLSSQGSDTLVATSTSEDYEDSSEQIVVVTADYSDSEGEDDVDGNYECDLNGNDPSLYKLVPAAPATDSDMMQIDDTASDNKTIPEPSEPVANPPLVFSKPPESLSFCTHISITCDFPLDSLEPLRESSSLLAMTSLCTTHSSPISSIADSLVYWELQGTNTIAEDAVKQSFASAFDLQLKVPERYPFIYLKLRDFTVVFKILQARRNKDGTCKRVAVINCSHRGMRKLLHEQNVEFSLPLAPQQHTWSEIPGTHEKSADIHRLHSSGIDKTPKSALLVMGNDNVDGLLGYIMSTSFKFASVFSTGPFINATMRQCVLRFAQVTTYVSSHGGQQQAKQLYKLDISGVVLPNAWSALVRALAEMLGPYSLAFKESQEIAHLNMLVSKQTSAVAGKHSVSYEPKVGFMYF